MVCATAKIFGLASAAEAPAEALVLRAQVGTAGAGAGAGRGPGGLHHRGAQRGVALAGAPGGSFAGRLVVARAQLGPGRQVRRAREAGHVRAGLGEDHPRRAGAEAGNRAQQLNRLGEMRDLGLHLGIEPIDRGGEVIDVVEQHAQQQRVVRAEPALSEGSMPCSPTAATRRRRWRSRH
jgi:hypothetical protein